MVKLAEIWIKFLVKFSQKFCVRGESFFDFFYLINRRVFIALPDNRKGSNDMYDTVRRGGQADTTRTGGEKSMKKRIISVLLLCCMVLGLLPTTTFANNGGAKAIQLGTSGISGYDSTNSSYDYIHFGTWNNSTVKWRVLDTKTNMANAQKGDGFFLLSDALLGTGEYGGVEFDYTTPYFNDWKGSRAQDWCNDFYSRSLSITEQKAVLATSKSDALYGMYYAASDNILDGDKVFFLSAEEAENAAYGFTDDNARIANYGDSAYVWWLRSPGRMNSDSAGTVNEKGAVIGEWVNQTNAARPAFNLKPDSVLLVSAAVGGKGTADGMFKIPEYSGDEWKLTLLDDTRTFRVTETTAAGKPGGTVTLNFSGPRTGQNEYISAIIEGKNGATYYGRIMKPTATDRQLSFTLPHDLASGNYKLHVFSEQYNGDYQTDYASQFQTVALTVEEAATEQFALTPGGTYYFDLSGENIPGTINDDLPDKSMHYVPFTYAGAVDAYKLTSEMATTEEYAEKNKYLHSLFVADYAVTGAVNWNILNNASLIFGKDYAADGVDYMLRAPSVGSDSTGSGNSRRGTPQSNEWDRILDKNDGYIKNWSSGYSWGQDTSRASSSHRGIRWNGSNHNWASGDTTYSVPALRFHPVLEVLNPDTLGADGLKAVTLDLGGGKLGGSSDRIQIIVKNGKSFTAPAFDGLTRPDGNTGSYFKWLGSDGELYEPGDNVSADVTRLTAQFALIEQFRLAPGDTYYFDLSAMGIPGTVNGALPDNTMHYVPFTYVGIVDAYKLKSAMATTEEYAQKNGYAHSLFVADYVVTHTTSWKELYAKDLIFGKGYAAGGVDYTLRMPSAGSGDTGSGNSKRGTPQSNEWDRILDKNDGYIKNWSGMSSWGQDTPNIANGNRALRGHDSIRNWGSSDFTISNPDIGFRPVLEVLNLGTLDSYGLKAITLDLGGGKLGNSSEDIQIIVKNGESFTAPASDGLTRPDGDTGSSFMWLGSDGKLYEPGDNVSADVTRLTAQFDEQFTLTIGDTYWFDLSGVGIPGTANSSLPDTSLHYVPFTYAGTVDAYKLTSEMVTTEEYAQKNEYVHSLFVADYVVTHTVGWDNLDDASLIFGKNYATGGISYTLRAPSTGSDCTGSGNSRRGTPQSNEWDRILDKDDGYIKNCGEVLSWGQDTASSLLANRARRGNNSARNWGDWNATWSRETIGFRPVLEVLNPDMLGSDGLKAVTLDLGGGKLGGSSEDIQIIVKNGESFTAPASDSLTRPDGDTGSSFMWLGSDYKLYPPGSSVPADVTRLTAQFGRTEQFTLAPGGTYYFDLSGESIPGTVNGSLPDTTLHYVPFTYTGTVDAYKLASAMATTEEYAEKNKYLHSLFVADYSIKYAVSWNTLNDGSLIFGRDYAADGVDYTLRAPSMGSGYTGSGASKRGTPQSNEWDRMLDKDDGYIKNCGEVRSWGQDTTSDPGARVCRGYTLVRGWGYKDAYNSFEQYGFRPVLEVLNPDTLGTGGLKAVTLDLGGGKLGGSSEDIQIIVKNGESFTAPSNDGLTRPDINPGSYFMWSGSDGKFYAPGDNVPAEVTSLTAQFGLTEQFTLVPGGTYYFDLSGGNIPGRANGNLPDTTLHYVPFIYAGAVDAYKLTSAMETTEEYARQNQYTHSLFVAYYDVTHLISWNNLNTAGMIFGKNYAAGGVDYTLRAPSAGSSGIGYPESNEWDRILAKDYRYIKNWEEMSSWGQDIANTSASSRVFRGRNGANVWRNGDADTSSKTVGFRPVLEVLNPDTLGSDGLKAVTLDLGGGKLGNSSEDIQIIVKNGSEFTAPASDGLTSPDGNTGSSLMWRDSDGKFYAPGDSVPANVNRLKAQFDIKEQFTLASGGTYYFDLSGMGIPGTINSSLPDTSLHYVPFTYAGTVDAYKLVSAMATTEEYAQQNKYPHSLFVADYAVTHTISWDNLNTAGLIFGKTYAADSMEYTLRAPSVGSDELESGESERGTPQSNEWDKILDKYDGYIKNWSWKYSWGQDNLNDSEVFRALRGNFSVRFYGGTTATNSDNSNLGFRPVLEVLNPDTLGTDGLKAVTLDLGGGKLGGSPDTIQIIVKNGESFTAPASDGLTRPDGNTDSYFKWRGSDGKLYAPGDNVPADVDKLTAQFDDSGSHTVTITTDALPDGKVGETYSQTLTADGTAPVTWSISSGNLPDGLKLDGNIGEISGEPTVEGTATFTVKAENSAGSDTKELSITITKDAPAEYTVTVTTEGSGTASASPAKAVAGTEITLTAMPDTGYRFREWQVIDGGVTIQDDKFTMPDKSVEVKAVFEEDTPTTPTDPAKPGISVTGTYTYNGSEHTAAVTGYDSTTMDISGNTGTDAGDYTVSVTSRTGKWADGSTEAVTAAWSISKATQEAPNGLAGVAPTTEGGSDGRITGVDTTMEYRMAGDGSYTACGGTEIENLSAGNYFVRYGEDQNHFASPDGEVTVGDGTPLADCAITFNAGGGSGSMESKTVKEGTNYILPACGFAAPTDQEFKAWEIGGTEYKVGDSYTVNGDTEIKALWKDSVIPPTTYTITISNDGNGSGTASPSAAVVGTEITLTAMPNTGYRFKEWEVISGGVVITNNKFTMPDGNVEVKAIFEKDALPAPTEYTVTVTSGGNGTASASHAKAVVSTEITLTVTPDTGYRFKEWEVISGGVAITNNKFTMPDGNVEVKAIFEKDAPPAPTEYTVTVTSGGNGTASASHAKAVVGTEITLTATPNTGYRFKEWEVISGGVAITNNKFTMPDGNVEVRAIFAMISQQTAPDPVNENTGIPSQPENGDTASSANTDSGTNNGAGAAPSSPFSATPGTEPAPGIKPGAENTRRTTPKDSILLREWQDKRDTTTITGDQPAADEEAEEGNNPFTDVSKDDWFYDDVMFVYENGLMEGISNTQFGPYETQTRGRMAEILWRMEGSPAPKAKNSFPDVEDGARYADAIAWITENDILSGYSKDSFEPGDPITWEQLAVMFYRYAQYKGYDISIKGSQDELKDMDSTMDDAGKAVLWAVSNGLIREEADVLSALQDPVSRAEIAAMLHRFIDKYKLVQGMTPNGQMGFIAPEEMNPSQTDRSRVPGWIGISLCAALTGGFVLFMLWLRHRRRQGI